MGMKSKKSGHGKHGAKHGKDMMVVAGFEKEMPKSGGKKKK